MSVSDSFSRIVRQVFFDIDKVGTKKLFYHIHDGVTSEIAYVENQYEEHESEDNDGLYRIRERSVTILSAVDGGVESPGVLDTVTISGEQWAISSISSDFVASHRLSIERRELIKKYRR